VSFCVVLKNQKNTEKKTVARTDFMNNKDISEKKLSGPKKAKNSFGALLQDSDDEEKPKLKPVVEDFPALCRAAKVVEIKPLGISYATQAAKVVLAKPVLTRQTALLTSSVEKNQPIKKSWADWTDSDDDDELDDELDEEQEEEQEEIDW
jgi:hypothetical protein